MLSGRDQRPLAVTENGGKFGGDHGLGNGANVAVAAFKSGPDKNKTRIHGCRSNRQINRQSGMDADTRHGSLRTQRCLPAEFHTEVPTLTYRETKPAPLLMPVRLSGSPSHGRE